MIFYIEKRHTKGDIHIESIKDIKSIEDLSLKGESFETIKENPFLTFKNSSGRKTDFIIGGTVLPIVSQKVKKILLENISNSKLEFLEFSNNSNYCILNVLNHISCFDWDNSIYTKYPERMIELANYPETIHKLVLKEGVIKEEDIFRMTEDSIELFLSEKIKELFISNNISGIDFKSIDEFEKW